MRDAARDVVLLTYYLLEHLHDRLEGASAPLHRQQQPRDFPVAVESLLNREAQLYLAPEVRSATAVHISRTSRVYLAYISCIPQARALAQGHAQTLNLHEPWPVKRAGVALSGVALSGVALSGVAMPRYGISLRYRAPTSARPRWGQQGR